MQAYQCLFAGMMCAASLAAATSRPLYRVEAVAGSSRNGDGGPAAIAQFGPLRGVAADRQGNVYVSDTDHHRVRKINALGIVSTIAGTGVPGFSGDGGPATAAALNLPFGLVLDPGGNLYIADLANGRVRRVSPAGVISTVAGGGLAGNSGDGGPALAAELKSPRNLALDPAGSLYVSEFDGHRVRKILPDGRITTAAGNGTAGFAGDGGLAPWAQLANPAGIALDRSGNLFIADSRNGRIRKVETNGFIRTILGGSQASLLLNPSAVAVDLAGNLYVADTTYTIRALTAKGAWTDFAGTPVQGFSGDGGPAGKAQLSGPFELTSDEAGSLWIADGVRLRNVDPRGNIRTVAGDGYLHNIGDGGAAADALLVRPSSVALDPLGNLLVADPGTRRVRRIAPSGTILTVAGTGVAGSSPEGTIAVDALLTLPVSVAVDPGGGIWIADTDAHRVRLVGTDGRVTNFAGTGVPGTGPDSQLPAGTVLRAPRGICTDRAGVLFIADTGNHRILRAARNVPVQLVAGTGVAGDAGDDGQARSARLNLPSACTVDSFGNLYIADTGNHRIRKVSPAGIISTLAGSGAPGFGGDEAPAPAADLAFPAGIAADDSGNVFIADTGNHRIRQVTADGFIHTIAGNGEAGLSGDKGEALEAHLNLPGGLFLDGAGDLYFADTGNDRVRRLVPAGLVEPEPIVEAAPLTAVNAASLWPGPVAPGELVTLTGDSVGPAIEIRIGGSPVPALYAHPGQLTVQMPESLSGKKQVRIETGTGTGLELEVAETAPGLFPVVINPEIAANSEAAPVARGAVVILHATGEGLHDAAGPKAKLQLTIGGTPAAILWAASAPGLAGTLQIFARIPEQLTSGAAAVVLTAGTAVSPPTTIWIQ